jgi:hypothetical protein
MTQNIEVLDKRVLVINDVEYDIIKEFFVPQVGWELDYMAYIIEYEGERRLVYSDHGELYIMDKDLRDDLGREDQNFIEITIEMQEEHIENLREAWELLQEEKVNED